MGIPYLLGQPEGTAELLTVVVPGPHLHPRVNHLGKAEEEKP